MANKIEKGVEITPKLFKKGSSSRGDWELFVTADERGNKEIAVFARNVPTGVKEGDHIKITEIISVNYSAKKDSNGNWRDQITVEANVEPIKVSASENPFEEMDENEEDLPF